MGSMTSPASDSLSEIFTRLDARIKRVDEERWLSSRYAKDADRHTLIILYAFYYELARVRVAVTDQTMGQIRFQWWREALEGIVCGTVREHDLVVALAEQLKVGRLAADRLMALIDQHQHAFLANDRALEPEAELAILAADILSSGHRVMEAIKSIAPDWARLRRGEPASQPFRRISIPGPVRPALAHFRLRRLWAKHRSPGPIRTRLSVLWAMLIGRL